MTTVPPDPASEVTGVPVPRPLNARRALFILLMYLVAQVAAVLLVMLSLAITSPSGLSDMERLEAELVDRGTIPSALTALLLGGLVVFRLTGRSFPDGAGRGWREVLGWKSASGQDLLSGAGLGLVLALFYLLVIGSLFPPADDQQPGPLVEAALSSTGALIGWAVAALVLAPPVEEFLFRGVVLAGLARSWGWPAAVATSIVVFTGLHYGETNGYWPGLIGIGILATVTTFARLRTGSLQPAIAVHVGYNLSIVGLLLWQTPAPW